MAFSGVEFKQGLRGREGGLADHSRREGPLPPVKGPHRPPGEEGESRGGRQEEKGHQEDREEDEALPFFRVPVIPEEASPHGKTPPSLPGPRSGRPSASGLHSRRPIPPFRRREWRS
ncbi:hypothetical protein SDC9_111550 [bioreactor metagenome]|uniref:Uncharacterized protein n=1 Tax=bioreactor metagenome TaxID=1076179 RepID=A0A645BHB6_9ZZZZ